MNRSESITNLVVSLAKLQSHAQNVFKDKKNEFGNYNYADLAAVLDITRPLCAEHSFAVTQHCESETLFPPPGTTPAVPLTNVKIETVLMHTSGEWISSVLSLPVQPGRGMSMAQAMGSCISYGRRYALASIIGIAQTDNDAALPPEDTKPVKKLDKGEPPKDPQDKMTSTLKDKIGATNELPLARLRKLIEDHKLQEKELGWLEHFKVASLDDLETKEVLRLIKTVEGKI